MAYTGLNVFVVLFAIVNVPMEFEKQLRTLLTRRSAPKTMVNLMLSLQQFPALQSTSNDVGGVAVL